jgi:hypothetical protein
MARGRSFRNPHSRAKPALPEVCRCSGGFLRRVAIGVNPFPNIIMKTNCRTSERAYGDRDHAFVIVMRVDAESGNASECGCIVVGLVNSFDPYTFLVGVAAEADLDDHLSRFHIGDGICGGRILGHALPRAPFGECDRVESLHAQIHRSRTNRWVDVKRIASM